MEPRRRIGICAVGRASLAQASVKADEDVEGPAMTGDRDEITKGPPR
jgi:hypothetical protein